MQIDIPNEEAMEQLGALLASLLTAPALLFLQGDLGMGKTTLARGFMRARGHQGAVKSPTYTLVEPYELAGEMIYHFDLYRLCDPEELEFMGIRDYLSGSIALVEWPDQGAGMLPQPTLEITLQQQGGGRRATIAGDEALTHQLQEQWSHG